MLRLGPSKSSRGREKILPAPARTVTQAEGYTSTTQL
jgi:hypothetical protein